MAFQRFIVCGDSYSEGMTDEVVDGKYRGWADRVADVMADAHADFTYMNLAVRGKLIGQVVEDQVPTALAFATGPDTLVSFTPEQMMRSVLDIKLRLLSRCIKKLCAWLHNQGLP